MPTYDYRCNACKHEFEQFQSMTAPLLKKCPSCGKQKLERLIGTGAALIFKGGGFYETDYRSDSYKKSAEADSKPAEAAKTDAKSETKAEAKTQTKAEPKVDSKPAAKPAAKAESQASKSKSKKSEK